MSDEKKPTTQSNLMGCFWGWLLLVLAILLFSALSPWTLVPLAGLFGGG